jgi:ABC-type dipeptide/oligopeptide/nickel transport system permease component
MRLVGVLAVLWFIGTITFVLMHAVPGGPWDEQKQALPPEVKHNLQVLYGLDRPLIEQYGRYWINLVHGDLGVPYQVPTETVAGLIARSWIPSAQLGLMALVLAVLVGVPCGVFAALRQNSWIDHLTTAVATLGNATPNFVIAILLVWLFSLSLHLLPPGGWDDPTNWIMPVLAFALAPMAICARYTRTAVLDVVHTDYVRTARAKGLLPTTVVLGHIVRSSLVPILTVIGPMAAALVTGSIFIESIFRIPGLGRYFSQSVFYRDYPMIMGLTLFYAALLAVAYLITDVLYIAVDPRISFSERG